MLFFNAAYLFADIGNRGRLDTPNSAFSFEGVAFFLLIVIIGTAIYLLCLKLRDYQENKSNKKTVKMNSSEWIRQENEIRARQIERQLKEAKESKKGCVFSILLFGGGIIWSIITTDTEWVDAGKDLLIIFGVIAILIGVVWFIRGEQFKQKRQNKWKIFQETIDNSCILQIIIIIIDAVISLSFLILLEWILFTYCTLNSYIKLALSVMIFIAIIKINTQVMKHYFPNLGTKKNPLYKKNDK